MEQERLSCVLFDHIMLENEQKANIPNYNELINLLTSVDIKTEIPHDMVEWIWLHMAINAGVTSTAAKNGQVDNPRQLALDLMSNSKMLAEAVKTIRETIRVVAARGVNLKLYNNEIMPYKLPACIAGIVMKRMFAGNKLARRIMTLHNDVRDILYGCTCLYKTGKQYGLELPLFYQNMDKIFSNK
jgi:2-dehydropantoate 2-reductase